MRDLQWLLRKKRGGLEKSIKVLGPYWSVQVREMFLTGTLDNEDELCAENSYWIGAHEREEIRKLLGVDPLLRNQSSGTGDVKNPNPDADQTAEIHLKEGVKENSEELQTSIPTKTKTYSRVTIDDEALKIKTHNPKFLGLEKALYWVILLGFGVAVAVVGIIWIFRFLTI